MRKFYSAFYVFFVSLYIAGRICLVSTYTIGNENVRDIKNRVLPENLLIETRNAVQNEKTIPAHLRKKTVSEFYFSISFIQNAFPVPANGINQTAYSGFYIDPPKLV